MRIRDGREEVDRAREPCHGLGGPSLGLQPRGLGRRARGAGVYAGGLGRVAHGLGRQAAGLAAVGEVAEDGLAERGRRGQHAVGVPIGHLGGDGRGREPQDGGGRGGGGAGGRLGGHETTPGAVRRRG